MPAIVFRFTYKSFKDNCKISQNNRTGFLFVISCIISIPLLNYSVFLKLKFNPPQFNFISKKNLQTIIKLISIYTYNLQCHIFFFLYKHTKHFFFQYIITLIDIHLIFILFFLYYFQIINLQSFISSRNKLKFITTFFSLRIKNPYIFFLSVCEL